MVTPTVLEDGSVHLRISAEVVDMATDRWGYPVEGSPVAARTELVVADGEEAIVASGSAVETGRRVGLLHLSSTERDREVLVTITPRILAAP
jgi:Flp pilus assembly secretin CpaC